MKTYLGKDKWTEADGMKTAIADTTINARLKLVRRPTIWRRIIAGAVALLALASQALSCDLWYSVGHSDDKGQVFVEDYNLSHEDCLRYQDDDPTWECWVQTDGFIYDR